MAHQDLSDTKQHMRLLWACAEDDPPAPIEHYCTLADSTYLPQAIALYESLRLNDSGAALWLLCMDDEAFETVRKMGLRHLEPIRLREVEWTFRQELEGVRASRSHGEYCWTLTPFVIRTVHGILNNAVEVYPAAVAQPGQHRVTYIDADCAFFSSPRRMLDRFTLSGAGAMITPHAFGPEYTEMAQAGQFCVQFMSFTNSEAATRILEDWSGQCADWCYARIEDGKFGDQGYLDEWPERYGDAVYVLDEPRLTLAPWNVEHLTGAGSVCGAGATGRGADGGTAGDSASGEFEPCMYHYHGFRWLKPHEAQLNFHYRLSGKTYARFYTPYTESLSRVMKRLRRHGFTLRVQQSTPGMGERLSLLIHTLRNERKTARIDY